MPRTSEVTVNGSVLRWARESAGFTLSTAADALGIGVETLEAIERGTAVPGRQLLKRMAARYKRAYAALLMPQVPDDIKPPTDYRTLPGTQRPFGPELALAIREAEKLQDLLTDIRDDAGAFPAFSPPGYFAQPIDQLPLEEVATTVRQFIGVDKQIRKQWTTTDSAFRFWRIRFQELGILVLVESMPREESRGFSLWSEGAIPTIIVSKNEAYAAQIFTLFHEVAHILRRSSALCLKDEGESSLGKIERWCNALAAATLVPSDELLELASRFYSGEKSHDWSLDDLGKASRFFRVSRHVIAIRLRELGLVSANYYPRITPQLAPDDIPPPPPERRESDEFKRNIPQERLLEIGAPAARAILLACRRSLISTSEAVDALRMRPQAFGRLEALVSHQHARYS